MIKINRCVWSFAAFSVIYISLSACSRSSLTPPSAQRPFTAFVVLGEEGAQTARALTEELQCPFIELDGVSERMEVRAPAGVMPARPRLSASVSAKPAAFPVLTCEKQLPPKIRHASIDGRPLPLKKEAPGRIVVIGDTGCRLQKGGAGFQACNDSEQFTFVKVAQLAARWKPDLVIHVGDYHYRETPCPDGNTGCVNSPWGYGYDTWREDFFRPTAPLLRAAPWVMARGNHESCSRAGQGWWRFLDPRPLLPGRDCNDPANDQKGDYSHPYAIPIGDDTQLIVLDTSNAPNKEIKPGDIRLSQYRTLYTQLETLAQRARRNIVVLHHPLLGFVGNYPNPDDLAHPLPENPGLQSVFRTLNPNFLPSNVDLVLSGHIHLFEQLSFSTAHPSQFVVGISGTQLETVPVPATLAPDITPMAGARIQNFDVWNGFGYMTMKRIRPSEWDVRVWNSAGQPVRKCHIAGRASHCEAVR
ncbi:Metallophosphoesterase precursor [Candidatus Glomeribacter gigasporarum BEG34]|uniref:Metallophosphoesterase n=1 Tax=Candidatus Glomeribacter gigasporarum BEG34 TaxID=1070319 RepID=G2J8I1_9BURK|nr:metallophosphoesterase [Candidatus Glomeribacter gigasporarum]CCD29078.1 Metallophosphoesterase precursor [Candidatus Glomeribacter gigasporarum BEG34]